MSTSVNVLKQWFAKLARNEQEEVVKFLYGGKALLRKGMFVGPYPDLIDEGLHCGPIPTSSTRSCPSCGRPF